MKKLYDFDKKGLNFSSENAMIVEVAKLTALHMNFGMWLSLVERCVRDAKAAGSNPVIPTKMKPLEFQRFQGFLLALFL